MTPLAVGMKVVCVDDGEVAGGSGKDPFILKGKIYTVRDLEITDFHVYGKRFAALGVKLHGVVRVYRSEDLVLRDAYYIADRFRPLVDVRREKLAELLSPSPEVVEETLVEQALLDEIDDERWFEEVSGS